MGTKEDVIPILNSRGRVESGANAKPAPEIVNLQAAVRELQDAVVKLAERLDALNDGVRAQPLYKNPVRLSNRASEAEPT